MKFTVPIGCHVYITDFFSSSLYSCKEGIICVYFFWLYLFASRVLCIDGEVFRARIHSLIWSLLYLRLFYGRFCLLRFLSFSYCPVALIFTEHLERIIFYRLLFFNAPNVWVSVVKMIQDSLNLFFLWGPNNKCIHILVYHDISVRVSYFTLACL